MYDSRSVSSPDARNLYQQPSSVASYHGSAAVIERQHQGMNMPVIVIVAAQTTEVDGRLLKGGVSRITPKKDVRASRKLVQLVSQRKITWGNLGTSWLIGLQSGTTWSKPYLKNQNFCLIKIYYNFLRSKDNDFVNLKMASSRTGHISCNHTTKVIIQMPSNQHTLIQHRSEAINDEYDGSVVVSLQNLIL